MAMQIKHPCPLCGLKYSKTYWENEGYYANRLKEFICGVCYEIELDRSIIVTYAGLGKRDVYGTNPNFVFRVEDGDRPSEYFTMMLGERKYIADSQNRALVARGRLEEFLPFAEYVHKNIKSFPFMLCVEFDPNTRIWYYSVEKTIKNYVRDWFQYQGVI